VDRLGGLAGMTLTALGLVTGHRPGGDDPARRAPTAAAAAGLVTVRPTMPAIEAFEVMCRLAVSGVGVMDDGGDALIANLAGPGRYRPPCHPLRFEPALLEINGIPVTRRAIFARPYRCLSTRQQGQNHIQTHNGRVTISNTHALVG